MALEVLVVDDEADIRELVSGVLEDEGYAVRTAGDSTQTLDAFEERRPSMVLLDVWLQGSRLDGLQLLQEIKRRDASLPVLHLKVAVPKYGWTDLGYSLAPNGRDDPYTAHAGKAGEQPLGVVKDSFVDGFFALGSTDGISTLAGTTRDDVRIDSASAAVSGAGFASNSWSSRSLSSSNARSAPARSPSRSCNDMRRRHPAS